MKKEDNAIPRSHRLIKQSGVYFGLSVYRIIVSALGLYIFSHYLKPEEFGILSLVIVFNNILTIFCNSGFANSLIRYFHDPEIEGRRPELISSVFWGTLGTIILAGMFIYLFNAQISALIFGKTAQPQLLWLGFIISATTALITLALSVWRMEEKAWRYVLSDGLNLTLGTLAGITLVVFYHLRVKGVLAGTALIQLLAAGVFLCQIFKKYKFIFRAPQLSRVIQFGFPFMLIHFSYWIMDWSDQLILRQLSNLKEIGLYSLGYKLGMSIMIVVNAYSTAAFPHLFSIFRQDDARKLYGQIAMAYSSVIALPLLLVCFIAPVYFRLLTPAEFHAAVWVVPFIAFAYSLRGLFNSFAVGIQLENRLRYLVILESFWAAVNILLNILLIPYLASLGAALATAITFLGLLASMVIINQRFYPLAIEWKRIFFPFLSTLAYISLFYVFILQGRMEKNLQIFWAGVLGLCGICTIYYFSPLILRQRLKEILCSFLPSG